MDIDSLPPAVALVYSVVVPLKNEEGNIEPLIHEIEHAMKALGKPWELICVDDGSDDTTGVILERMQRQCIFLKSIFLDRSYGQSAALAAGFDKSRGEFIITLDGDGQNDPADIPKLILLMTQHDLVCGHRIHRCDHWLKRLMSRIANAIRSRVCRDGIRDTCCSLKVMRKSALSSIKLYDGMHRFLPALFLIEGFRVREVAVSHRPRVKGKSKYHVYNRLLKPMVDMLAVAWMRRRHLKKPGLKIASPKRATRPRSLFVLAGEHSGDLHGGAVLKALRREESTLKVLGIGGPQMIQQGLELTIPMQQLQVFGFTDIVKKLGRLWNQYRRTRDLILKEQPSGVLLIDYPGFNLRLAEALRRKGYQGKIFYYICPTVWAWGQGRIQQLANTVDALFTIFPFEPPLFEQTRLPVTFVGHPLVHAVQNYSYDPNWYQQCGIIQPKRSLAVFPGSRESEIKRLLKRQIAAALKLKQADPELEIYVSCADESLKKVIASELNTMMADIHLIPRRFTYEMMRDCHLALTKSGTITLELALHNKPSVVVYDVSTLNRLIARYALRLKLSHYCIVNILCGKTVFPEFIENHFNANDLFLALERLYHNGAERRSCLTGCAHALDSLKTPLNLSPADHVAKAIREQL